MKLFKEIGEDTLEIECSPTLQAPAEALLKVLSDLNQKGPTLQDGSKILYGWVKLKLNKIDNLLKVCEPDFLNDSSIDYIPQVNQTLQVLEDQGRLIHQLGCHPKATLYSDTIIVAKSCLSEEKIYLERQKPSKEGDSGWYIGSTERKINTDSDLDVIQAYQLLKLRPKLMQVLLLPVNYLVVFSGNLLEVILDDNNIQVWPFSCS